MYSRKFSVLCFVTIICILIVCSRYFTNQILRRIITANKTVIKSIDDWNFTINSWIQMKLEAEITPELNSFVHMNEKYLTEILDPQLSLTEQIKHFGSMASIVIKIPTAANQFIFLVFSRVWYSKIICHSACNPDRSYIYGHALTSDYRPISYNLSHRIHFPSILNITQMEVDECCLGPEDPRIVQTENNQIFLCFNMIDVDKKRKIWFYDIFNSSQIAFTIKNHPISSIEKNWSPFIFDGKLHFIYSYNPLEILQCETNNGSCEFITKKSTKNSIGSLRGGTQIVQYRNSNYFVGIARTTISCRQCQRFYRPHLIVLSRINREFHLVYVSEPLMLDRISLFASYYQSESKHSKDFCSNFIRIMTPGSIIDWQWPDDKLTFTISINDKRSYSISINGIGNIISTIERKYSHEKIVAHRESMALNYCEMISK